LPLRDPDSGRASLAADTKTTRKLPKPGSFRSVAWLALAAAVVLTAAADRAVAEDRQGVPAPPPVAAPAPSPQQPTPPESKPGLLHQLKVWWERSISVFDTAVKDTRGTMDDLNRKSGDAAKGALDATKGAATATEGAMKGALDATKGAASATQDAMKGALDATKGATDVIVRLPNTRVLDMHAHCATAANGAPDCAAAATDACRARGFKSGQPLDVRTAEKCDTTPAWQSGRVPSKSECAIESWVARAVCQ